METSPTLTGRVRLSTTPEERAEWVRLFETSGKSPAEFCRELGLAESTFAVWRRQVREANESVTFTDVPQPLVEAALAGEDPAPTTVSIRLTSGTLLEVPVGTDAAWLAQLLGSLR